MKEKNSKEGVSNPLLKGKNTLRVVITECRPGGIQQTKVPKKSIHSSGFGV